MVFPLAFFCEVKYLEIFISKTCKNVGESHRSILDLPLRIETKRLRVFTIAHISCSDERQSNALLTQQKSNLMRFNYFFKLLYSFREETHILTKFGRYLQQGFINIQPYGSGYQSKRHSHGALQKKEEAIFSGYFLRLNLSKALISKRYRRKSYGPI